MNFKIQNELASFSLSGSWMGLGSNQLECDFMGALHSFSFNGFGNSISHVVCRQGPSVVFGKFQDSQ